jgi:hypothetical protein
VPPKENASLIWLFQAGQGVKKRRLSRSRCATKEERLTMIHLYGDALQYMNVLLAHMVNAVQIAGAERSIVL